MRLAVVGSGIAGLGAAYLLSRHAEVQLFEADTRLGGHAHTVDVDFAGRQVAVDTGFIVYNEMNYPNLVGLFEHLGVATKATDMSFAVSLRDGSCEYEGSLRGLFAQPSNLFNPRWRQMLGDLVQFYRHATDAVAHGPDAESLAGFIARMGYSRAFLEDHLLPMAAAIWSCPVETMMAFPARSFIRFMNNHRLLDFYGRPQWQTVANGSREYVSRIAGRLGNHVNTAAAVSGLRRQAGGVMLEVAGKGEIWFDRVILACHADQALAMICDANSRERQILGSFGFQPNQAVLHSDASLMPRRRAAWASWNYLTGSQDASALCVTYWMNRLQGIAEDTPLFVTLNPIREPDPRLVHGSWNYDHPVFDHAAINAQQALPLIQGVGNLYYAGAWTGYGFHEDGLASAVAVARSLGASIPWSSPTRALLPADDAAGCGSADLGVPA